MWEVFRCVCRLAGICRRPTCRGRTAAGGRSDRIRAGMGRGTVRAAAPGSVAAGCGVSLGRALSQHRAHLAPAQRNPVRSRSRNIGAQGGWRRTTVGECGASQIATVARPSGLQRSFKQSGCLGWLCCWPSSRCMWQGRRAAKEGRTCALAERLLHPHHAAWGSEMTFRLGLAQSEKAYSWPT